MGKASNKKKQNREPQKGDVTASRGEIKYAYLPAYAMKTYLHLILIAIIGFIAYSNTFHVPFVFDGVYRIKGNEMIRDLNNLFLALKGHAFPPDQYNPRRFVAYLSFALNYKFGGVDVTGYHLTNLFIHIVNSVLVYFFVQLTFKTPYFKSQDLDGPPVSVDHSIRTVQYSKLIPLFSALLFVSHPLQTQAVTYVVQRLASLTTLFYLLSFVFYIKGRTSLGSEDGAFLKSQTSVFKSLTFFSLSLISAVLAMKTKEIAFTLPLVIVLYEFTFFAAPLKKKLLFLLPVALTLIIVPISVMHSGRPLGDLLSDLSEKTRVQSSVSRWDYLMTEIRVITTYIRLIFAPVNQNLDYDYPIYHSLFTPSVFLSFLFLLALFGLGVYLLSAPHARRLKDPDSAPYYRLIGFGVLWFFITLSVESSFIPIADVIFEHRVYLPSAGFFTAITAGIFIAATKLKKEKSIVPIFVVITFALATATYARNNTWKDDASLWEDVVAKSPDKARPHYQVGEVYDRQGRLDEAIREYQAAIRLNPDYAEAHNNLGVIYDKQGRLDEAIREYQTVLRLKPDSAKAHNNLGMFYYKQGRLDEAIIEYKAAARLNPDNDEVRNNLGVIYDRQGRLDEAMREYQTAASLNPDNNMAHYNIGRVYDRQDRLDEAIKEYQTAARLKPDYADAHNNLGAVYYKQGRLDEAIREFQAAVRLNPDNAEARNNLEILNGQLKSKKLQM